MINSNFLALTVRLRVPLVLERSRFGPCCHARLRRLPLCTWEAQGGLRLSSAWEKFGAGSILRKLTCIVFIRFTANGELGTGTTPRSNKTLLCRSGAGLHPSNMAIRTWTWLFRYLNCGNPCSLVEAYRPKTRNGQHWPKSPKCQVSLKHRLIAVGSDWIKNRLWVSGQVEIWWDVRCQLWAVCDNQCVWLGTKSVYVQYFLEAVQKAVDKSGTYKELRK